MSDWKWYFVPCPVSRWKVDWLLRDIVGVVAPSAPHVSCLFLQLGSQFNCFKFVRSLFRPSFWSPLQLEIADWMTLGKRVHTLWEYHTSRKVMFLSNGFSGATFCDTCRRFAKSVTAVASPSTSMTGWHIWKSIESHPWPLFGPLHPHWIVHPDVAEANNWIFPTVGERVERGGWGGHLQIRTRHVRFWHFPLLQLL